MLIRKATKADSEMISEFIFLAMEDIFYAFIGEKNTEMAKEFLRHFAESENNQYSYSNCIVAESQNQIVGAVNIYDGAKLETLREPIVHYFKKHFELDFNPEDETGPGEYYIDTIAVSPNHQGKGIGTKLLKFIIETYVITDKRTVGLLVDSNNPGAEKLYLNLGFELEGTKVLAGKQMKHLQIKPDVKRSDNP